MGIFSTNRYSSVGSNVVIEAAEGYHGEIGAAIAMLEGYQNDMALFNGIIATDFQEACLIQEGASAEEVYILQEGALKGAWEKLKEFFKKLGEKIKGIFHAFIAKLDSVFMKDSKKFYDKYAQEIRIKDIKDLYVPCRNLKENDVTSATIDFTDTGTFTLDTAVGTGGQAKLDNIKERLSDFDSDKAFSDAVKVHVSALGDNITKESFEKAYFDHIFNEKNDVKFSSSDILTGWVGSILSNNKGLENLKKKNTKVENVIKKYIEAIDKLEKEATKALTAGKESSFAKVGSLSVDDKGNLDDATKTAMNNKNTMDTSTDSGLQGAKIWQAVYQLSQKKANVLQDVFNSYAATSVKAYKEACSTARKIFAAAVAYSPKKENAELAIAVGDSAYYEACDLIDNMYYVAD